MKNQGKREHSLELELLLDRKWKELCPCTQLLQSCGYFKEILGRVTASLLRNYDGDERWKLSWISSQGPAHGSISKGPLFPSVGHVTFVKMQPGRNVKQNYEAFCLLPSSSKALSYPSLLRRLNIFKFWGPKEFKLTIWQWHLQAE